MGGLDATGPPPGAEVPNGAPRHVAITMDGNGRWARERSLPRLAGHRAGTENIRVVLEALERHGIPYVTIYAFSTENWGRPEAEVEGLIQLLGEALEREVRALHERNVRILHLGSRSRLPAHLAEAIEAGLELTKRNDGLTLCVGFDYGGRREIVDAVRELMAQGATPDEVTEDAIRGRMYLPEVPEPDLIIRTGGDQRLSNFLLWQAAYSELYFTPTLWPDFGQEGVDEAIDAYRRRPRRFGKAPDAD
ncbi:MAG: polyprenyl diphosphate synthase [Chloroflexota bacterium]|nr:polyprenyl diphosphate synthase [Chloroflexota bacterium]